MQSYQVHDNGGRPFTVKIQNNQNIVDVFRTDNNQLVCHFNPIKIFIGKSPLIPMTQYSGGYGAEFDGNTILLQITEYKYVFIGWKIFSFETDSEIVEYASPVGNNDVPYPLP